MEKLMFNQISHEKYIGIITILDYEIRLSNCLAELSFPTAEKTIKKVLVDLALKSGINQYRFVEFDLVNNGKIDLSSNKYMYPTSEIQSIANEFLQKKKEIVMNSILPDSQKAEILNMYSMA